MWGQGHTKLWKYLPDGMVAKIGLSGELRSEDIIPAKTVKLAICFWGHGHTLPGGYNRAKWPPWQIG